MEQVQSSYIPRAPDVKGARAGARPKKEGRTCNRSPLFLIVKALSAAAGLLCGLLRGRLAVVFFFVAVFFAVAIITSFLSLDS
jgi:hypothetical protein